MTITLDMIPDDIDALKAALIAERAERIAAQAVQLRLVQQAHRPVMAKGKTVTARSWVYVRDDRPFGGKDPPAAVFYYSRDRSGEHSQRHLASYAGIRQLADTPAEFQSLPVRRLSSVDSRATLRR